LLDEQPSSTYPVDLIKGVGLKDNAGDNTGTRGGNQIDLELAEEDVAGAADGGGLLLVGDAEDGTLLLVVGEGGTVGEVEEAALALGEINGEVSTDGRVGRAVCWCATSCQSLPSIHALLASTDQHGYLPFLVGSHRVKVWAETIEAPRRARRAPEIAEDRIFVDMQESVLLEDRVKVFERLEESSFVSIWILFLKRIVVVRERYPRQLVARQDSRS